MSSGCRAALLAAAARAKRVPTPTGGSRAAIAAIFRQTADGADEVLFIRRQERDGDPWSGHVAMPGGKQEDADADDEYTAMREAHEEVGLDLSDATIYQRFGRLVDDRIVQSRGRSMVTGMFGFAVKGTNSCPLLAPQADEIADAWWVDIQHLSSSRLSWRVVGIEEWGSVARNRPWLVSLLRALGCDQVRFAAIDMPAPPGAQPLSAEATSEASRCPAALGSASHSAVAEGTSIEGRTQLTKQYQLWGLTLAFYSDWLRASGVGQPLVGEGAPPAFRDAIAPGVRGTVLSKPLFSAIKFAFSNRAAKARAARRLGLWCAAGLAGIGLATAVLRGD
jgi:8-oxo-dGTP pyrophosphatase MutT (NUDIX family)